MCGMARDGRDCFRAMQLRSQLFCGSLSLALAQAVEFTQVGGRLRLESTGPWQGTPV